MANYDPCNISLKYRAIFDIPLTFTAVYQTPEFGHRLIYIRYPIAFTILVVPCMVHNHAFGFGGLRTFLVHIESDVTFIFFYLDCKPLLAALEHPPPSEEVVKEASGAV